MDTTDFRPFPANVVQWSFLNDGESSWWRCVPGSSACVVALKIGVTGVSDLAYGGNGKIVGLVDYGLATPPPGIPVQPGYVNPPFGYVLTDTSDMNVRILTQIDDHNLVVSWPDTTTTGTYWNWYIKSKTQPTLPPSPPTGPPPTAAPQTLQSVMATQQELDFWPEGEILLNTADQVAWLTDPTYFWPDVNLLYNSAWKAKGSEINELWRFWSNNVLSQTTDSGSMVTVTFYVTKGKNGYDQVQVGDQRLPVLFVDHNTFLVVNPSKPRNATTAWLRTFYRESVQPTPAITNEPTLPATYKPTASPTTPPGLTIPPGSQLICPGGKVSTDGKYFWCTSGSALGAACRENSNCISNICDNAFPDSKTYMTCVANYPTTPPVTTSAACAGGQGWITGPQGGKQVCCQFGGGYVLTDPNTGQEYVAKPNDQVPSGSMRWCFGQPTGANCFVNEMCMSGTCNLTTNTCT